MGWFGAFFRAARVVLTAAAFSFFFLGGAVLSWIVLPLIALFVRDRWERGRKCQRVVRVAFRIFHAYMRWVRILHFEPRKLAVSMPSGPCVIVANHPTLVDVTALLSVLTDVAVVSKPAMYRSPIVGRLLRLCLHVEGARDPLVDGARVLRDCLERLEHGQSILIFPEGTRSPIGEVGAFKRGAFEVAARAKVLVCRFGIRCEPPVLSRQHPWWHTPRETPRMVVSQLASADPATWSGSAIAMARAVHSDYDAYVTSGR